MIIQYTYAALTMVPCPLWFLSRYASSAFLVVVFAWSIYNGSTYYIDVFGKRFQKELEAMKAEVTKWQNAPELMPHSPLMTPHPEGASSLAAGVMEAASPEISADQSRERVSMDGATRSDDDIPRTASVDQIPLLDDSGATGATGVDGGAMDVARERKMAKTQ